MMRLDSGLSDYHSQLLAMRMQSGLEGVEIGPVLGRGSFGCGFVDVVLSSPTGRCIVCQDTGSWLSVGAC